MNEQEILSRFVVSVRGYGDPDKVRGDHHKALSRLLEHHFGERHELLVDNERD